MARTKQVKPIERQPSSEYVGGQNKTSGKQQVDSAMAHSDKPNGALKSSTRAVPAAAAEQADAGVLQLVIAVAGIYGSLYEYLSPFYKEELP